MDAQINAPTFGVETPKDPLEYGKIAGMVYAYGPQGIAEISDDQLQECYRYFKDKKSGNGDQVAEEIDGFNQKARETADPEEQAAYFFLVNVDAALGELNKALIERGLPV